MVTSCTLHLPLHTLQPAIIFSSVKELYPRVKIPWVSSHAPKSSSAWAPALPRASQAGGPEQARLQSKLQVGARRRFALTPEVTSPGWEGEDHSRFSRGCQPLDAHRAVGAGQCRAKPCCCRQAVSRKVYTNARMAPRASAQYGWGVGGGLFIKRKGHNSCHQPPHLTDITLGKHLLEK